MLGSRTGRRRVRFSWNLSSVDRAGAKRALSFIGVAGLSALAAQAQPVVGLRPFGVALFAAGLECGLSPLALFLGCGAGVLMSGDMLAAIWQVAGCALMVCLTALGRMGVGQNRVRIWVKMPALVLLAALVPQLAVPQKSVFHTAMAMFSALGAACLAPVLTKGMRALRRGRRGAWAQVGTIVLAAMGIWGLAGTNAGGAQLSLAAAFCGVLALSGMGAAQGAVAGAGLGMALMLSGQEPMLISVLCLCGLLSGLAAGFGRWAQITALFSGCAIALYAPGVDLRLPYMPVELILGGAAFRLIPQQRLAKLWALFEPSIKSRGNAPAWRREKEVADRLKAGVEMADAVAGYMRSLPSNPEMRAQEAAGCLAGSGFVMESVLEQMRQSLAPTEEAEEWIVQALLQQGLEAEEALLYPGEAAQVYVLLKKGQWEADNAEIARSVISLQLGMEMGLGWKKPMMHGRQMLFVQIPPMRVKVGVAARPKVEGLPSGDAYMIRGFPGGRVMVALSDGMGSGVGAADESQACLKLLEKHLRARVPQDMALQMVNRLLLLRGAEDMFATMDLCVLDLTQGRAHFDKLGACTTLLKRGNRVVRIEGGRMPMGILGRITPLSRTVAVKPGDMLLMVSDGVADSTAQEQEKWLEAYVGAAQAKDPQKLAGQVLEAAQRRRDRRPDDMTVLALRIEKRAG